MSATMLTQMTGGSPVVVVARLADVSEELVGIVYVFANGVEPDETPRGPLGFQPDVFDSAPGDPDYTSTKDRAGNLGRERRRAGPEGGAGTP
jgi:hypothetical protein